MADSPLAERAQAMRLISEHEMGELFKVIGFATHTHTHTPMPMHWQAQGFAAGDRSHKL
jgi:SAM-dependent MidA family methyltransferase